MFVTIYCDTTNLFSENEIMKDNLCEMEFDDSTVREFYNAEGDPNLSFEDWIKNEYTADDTWDLYQFALDKGDTPTFGVDGTFYVYDEGHRYLLFCGSYDDCRAYCRDRNWTAYIDDEEYELAVYDCEGNCA